MQAKKMPASAKSSAKSGPSGGPAQTEQTTEPAPPGAARDLHQGAQEESAFVQALSEYSHYDILGVSPTEVSDEMITAVYRKLAVQWHPDRSRGNAHEATYMMSRINAARDALRTAADRERYDESLRPPATRRRRRPFPKQRRKESWRKRRQEWS